MNMEKGFLLDRIALESRHVTERHAQLAGLVKAYFANTASAFRDEAAMAASYTANSLTLQMP